MNGSAKYWIQEIYRYVELALLNAPEETSKCLNAIIDSTIELEKVLYGKPTKNIK